jgi:hypothetical protein
MQQRNGMICTNSSVCYPRTCRNWIALSYNWVLYCSGKKIIASHDNICVLNNDFFMFYVRALTVFFLIYSIYSTNSLQMLK